MVSNIIDTTNPEKTLNLSQPNIYILEMTVVKIVFRC